MLVFEFKAYGKLQQFAAIDEAIRVVQFIRNKCIRLWMDNPKINKYDLSKYSSILAKDFPFASLLNAMSRQASADRAWASISRFFDNCKNKVAPASKLPGGSLQESCGRKKGYPTFQKDNRSIEYKTQSWKLAKNRKSITFTDKLGIGKLKLKGTRDLNFYQPDQIKRVRIVKRADGYYIQFCIQADRVEKIEPSQQTIGLDVGTTSFYTDSFGNKIENPRFYRIGEQKIKRVQKLVSLDILPRMNDGGF